jgi:hypothetical protein
MRRLLVILLLTAGLAGCLPPPPLYKDPLAGIMPVSPAVFPIDAPVTVEQPAGLIVSDNTELYLQYYIASDKAINGNFGSPDDDIHRDMNPKFVVDRITYLLRSRYPNIELIDDMNAADRLRKKTIFVVDVQATFKQIAGQTTMFDFTVFAFDTQRRPVSKITGHGEAIVPLQTVAQNIGVQAAANQALQELDHKITASFR